MKKMKIILIAALAAQVMQPLAAADESASSWCPAWLSNLSAENLPNYETWQGMSDKEKALTGGIAVIAVLGLLYGGYKGYKWATKKEQVSAENLFNQFKQEGLDTKKHSWLRGYNNVTQADIDAHSSLHYPAYDEYAKKAGVIGLIKLDLPQKEQRKDEEKAAHFLIMKDGQIMSVDEAAWDLYLLNEDELEEHYAGESQGELHTVVNQ